MKESEIDFRNIVLSSSDAIIITDADGKIEFMNPATKRFLKCEPGKKFGLPLVDGEIDIFRPKEESGTGDVHVIQTEWANKKVYLITIHDLSEKMKREQSADKMIRAVFDTTYQFIGMMTPDGTLIKTNKTAMKFAGITESDCLGKPFWDTPWWTHSADMQNKLREAIKEAAGGKTVFFEASHPDREGTIHYIDFSITPVMDESGKIVYLIPEGRDITERKKIEETLKEQVHEMEVLVDASMDREQKMIELKEKIKHLEEKLREKG